MGIAPVHGDPNTFIQVLTVVVRESDVAFVGSYIGRESRVIQAASYR